LPTNEAIDADTCCKDSDEYGKEDFHRRNVAHVKVRVK
jgi:hypothetical protein